MKTRLFACAAFSALFCLGLNAQTWVKGTGKLYTSPTSTKIGIGTTAPAYNLDVNGTTRTTKMLITQPNATTNWNTLWQSGFYEGHNASNAPGIEEWYWGIHMGHSYNNSNYRHGGQIAVSFNEPRMYFRSVDVSGKGEWKEVMTKDEPVLEHISQITLNPNDNFSYDQKEWGNYAIGWSMDSWEPDGPTGWISAWGGIKFFTGTSARMVVAINRFGNVGIGTDAPGVKLDVIGTIRAHEVKVCLNQGCDYVFAPDYDLMSLPELEQFVSTNRHLPEVAPAAVMEQDGISLSEMNALLLKKIEELTLHVIDLNKRIETLENGNK